MGSTMAEQWQGTKAMTLRDASNESTTVAGDAGVVLETKLAIPTARVHLLARPVVMQRLAWAVESELALVSAPAGFGKTTILAHWASQMPPVAWLSLDPGDDDPVRFVRYLIAAVRRIHERFGEQLATLIAGPARPSHGALATALVNELAALPDETAIVLDDYHVLGSRDVHGLLGHLADHLPEHLHLVISSREDPPLPLARLRARGKLRELRVADLRFDAGEVSALFNGVWGFNLPGDVLDAVGQRTEGWAAGLQLAALALREAPDVAAFADAFTGTHRFVLDFLSEEVLDRQPEDVRRFLLDTSVLERITASLADALTGRPDSTQVLERLEHANLFVVPLDEYRRWYRYHQLFAEMLRARLRLEAPEKEAPLHRAAAEWCEQHDMVDEAIRHWLASGETGRAAELIERYIEEVLVRWVEAATMDRWLTSLPQEVLRSRRRLILARGLAALAEGRLDEVGPVLDAAERAPAPEEMLEPSIGRRASLLRNVPAVMALMRADLARLRGVPEQVRAQANEALAHARPEEFIVSDTGHWQLAVGDWMSGRLDDAERRLRDTVANREAEGEVYLAALAACDLGRVQQAAGRLRAAAQTFRRAIHVAAWGSGMRPPVASWPLAGLAAIERQRGHLDEAFDAATEAADLCRYLPWAPPMAVALPALAWIHRARGDAEAALTRMEEAVRAIPSDEVTSLINPASTERIRLLLAQGRFEEPFRWIDERGIADTDEMPYPREPEYLVLGRVLIAKREAERAVALLDRLRARAEAEHRTASVIETRVLLALALEVAREREEALAQLAAAVSHAWREGFVAVFADEGEPMATLLKRLAGRRDTLGELSSVPPEYIARLIRASSSSEQSAGPGQIVHVPDLVEHLTARELEVLRWVALGRANREIADELFVTLDTVKKHVSHACAKLGAANRTQAVIYARELGLIR
jgi:LuxR family transcriptional regulator, maltose regulon positive regulatory protein